ncbi:hypothetical protein D3C72_1713030 [compost metagenome]
MVDPARRIAAELCVDHVVFIHVKVKRVVGLQGVVRVPVLRFLPANHFARVLHKDFAFRNILHGKHALAMDARAPGLDAAARCKGGGGRRCGAGHGKNSVNLIVHTCVRARVCVCMRVRPEL